MPEQYFLMNKDIRLLKFRIEKSLSEEVCIETASYATLRPYGFVDIDTWVNNRNYTKHKAHLTRWLKEWQINDVQGFIEVTHCLGLNDCLWVKKEDSNLSWADINLYENEFSDISERTAFEKGLNGLQLTSTSPEFTSEGSFAKCWKRKEDGTIYLMKKGSEGFANAGLETYSEYYASQVAEVLCTDTVDYGLVKFKGSLCSTCRIFTSQELGFVPFYKMLDTRKRQTVSAVLSACAELGFEEEFRRMMVADSVTFNVDRHLGNFGFLADNDTFEIRGFAPVFDFNMSLMCRAMADDISINDPLKYIRDYGQEHKLGGSFSDVGKALLTPPIKADLKKLRGKPFQKHAMYNLPDERLEILEKAVGITRDIILDKKYVRNAQQSRR